MSWRSRTAAAVIAVLAIAPVWATTADTEEPLSLEECIREALAGNPDLGAASARADAADAGVAVAAAGRLPRLDMTAGYLYSELAQRLLQPSFQGEALRYDNDIAEGIIEVRVPLFAGGRLVGRTRVAELTAAASHLSLASSRHDLVSNVVAAYLAVIEQRVAIDAVQASLKSLDAQVDVARAMEEVGRIAPLDRLKVEVRAAAVRQRLSRARRDRELILHHLATLIGRGPEQGTPDVGAAPAPLAVDSKPDALVAEALESRPDLGAVRHDVGRAKVDVALIAGERWPVIDAYARYTARLVLPPEGGSPPGHGEFGSGGVSLRMPLWTGGEIAARLTQARARLAEAENRLRAAELRITEEVRREVAGYAEAVEREEVASRALQQARDAFAIEQANWELGRSTINDVLDAQAALLEAELAQAQARHDFALAGVLVARAAGRDLAALLVGKEGERR